MRRPVQGAQLYADVTAVIAIRERVDHVEYKRSIILTVIRSIFTFLSELLKH